MPHLRRRAPPLGLQRPLAEGLVPSGDIELVDVHATDQPP
eukprot:SAG25_NODE_10909_length_320_cov_0.524887_1_plen_39_part_10